MAVQRPDIPAPMITTAASVWSLFPTGTCGQGRSPVMTTVKVLFLGSDVKNGPLRVGKRDALSISIMSRPLARGGHCLNASIRKRSGVG